MPLDLEIRKAAARQKECAGQISSDQRIQIETDLLNEWQIRWQATSKGGWTKEIIPDVRTRYGLDMAMDHYSSQLLSGHGDFMARLHSFKLVDNPNCRCGHGSETVRHVLYMCTRTEAQRLKLKNTLLANDCSWPPAGGEFLKSRVVYEALRKFAREALRNRTDR